MSITSVISYGTVNIRSALSDGGSILHDLPLVKYLYFLVLRPESFTGLLEVSVSGRRSVRSSLSSRDRNQRGQLPMSQCPSKQEMAKRHTHSCLLALAWVTVSPPSESHGHASLCQTQNDTELQVRAYTHVWGSCGVRKVIPTQLMTDVTLRYINNAQPWPWQPNTGTRTGYDIILQKEMWCTCNLHVKE